MMACCRTHHDLLVRLLEARPWPQDLHTTRQAASAREQCSPGGRLRILRRSAVPNCQASGGRGPSQRNVPWEPPRLGVSRHNLLGRDQAFTTTTTTTTTTIIIIIIITTTIIIIIIIINNNDTPLLPTCLDDAVRVAAAAGDGGVEVGHGDEADERQAVGVEREGRVAQDLPRNRNRQRQ
jgi:hypothetical protein